MIIDTSKLIHNYHSYAPLSESDIIDNIAYGFFDINIVCSHHKYVGAVSFPINTSITNNIQSDLDSAIANMLHNIRTYIWGNSAALTGFKSNLAQINIINKLVKLTAQPTTSSISRASINITTIDNIIYNFATHLLSKYHHNPDTKIMLSPELADTYMSYLSSMNKTVRPQTRYGIELICNESTTNIPVYRNSDLPDAKMLGGIFVNNHDNCLKLNIDIQAISIQDNSPIFSHGSNCTIGLHALINWDVDKTYIQNCMLNIFI